MHPAFNRESFGRWLQRHVDDLVEDMTSEVHTILEAKRDLLKSEYAMACMYRWLRQAPDDLSAEIGYVQSKRNLAAVCNNFFRIALPRV